MSTLAYLDLAITRLDAHGLPRRSLIVDCTIRNPNAVDVFIADAWVEVRLGGGLQIGEGRLFHQMHNLVDPAVATAGGASTVLGQITIPLDALTIDAIEHHRKGGDVTLEIDSRVLVCLTDRDRDGLQLRTPGETRFGRQGDTGSVVVSVPQSDWIKLLRKLQWSELELLEIAVEGVRTDPRLAVASERLRDAELQFWEGHWEAAIQECRKAWEAGARVVTGKQDRGEALKTLGEKFGRGAKAAQLNALAKSFGDFVHLSRHDQPERVTFTRADARLALHLTRILLSYLAVSVWE